MAPLHDLTHLPLRDPTRRLHSDQIRSLARSLQQISVAPSQMGSQNERSRQDVVRSCVLSLRVISCLHSDPVETNSLTLGGVTRPITQVAEQGNSAITYKVDGGWPDPTNQQVVAAYAKTGKGTPEFQLRNLCSR